MRRHLLGVLSIHKTDNHIPKRQPNLAEVLKSPLAAIESRSNDNAAALKDTAQANSKSVRLRAALNMISQLALVVSNCKINKIICGGVKKSPRPDGGSGPRRLYILRFTLWLDSGLKQGLGFLITPAKCLLLQVKRRDAAVVRIPALKYVVGRTVQWPESVAVTFTESILRHATMM